MYTIIGKGFGLYGYLPAVLLNNSKLILTKDYKSYVEQRSDVDIFLNQIDWSKNILEAVQQSNNIILAIPPLEQFKFLMENKDLLKNKILFLEKPIANSPNMSFDLLSFLENENLKFCVNYSFLYLGWFQKLKNKINALNTNSIISIRWEFRAHHLKNNIFNWKSELKSGGGIIRFYGVHLIAVLASLNYHNCKIVKSKYNHNYAVFGFVSSNKPDINIIIDIDASKEIFLIEMLDYSNNSSEIIIESNDPFYSSNNTKSNILDRRVEYLRKYLLEKKSTKKNLMFNKKEVTLWNQIELYR